MLKRLFAYKVFPVWAGGASYLMGQARAGVNDIQPRITSYPSSENGKKYHLSDSAHRAYLPKA